MPFFKSKLFWIIIGLLVILIITGFFLGSYFLPQRKAPITQNSFSTSQKIFANQSATIKGKIIKISTSQITIQNNLGVTGEFRLADKIFITRYDSLGQSYLTSNVSEIELNKDTIINLELPSDTNGLNVDQSDYRIIAVNFLPPLPKNNSKVATGSSILKNQ